MVNTRATPATKAAASTISLRLAARRGHHHYDFGHAGHVRGHGVHNHRAGIRGFAAGHVNADAVERADLLAEQGAVFIGVVPRLHFLALVVAFHAGGRLL